MATANASESSSSSILDKRTRKNSVSRTKLIIEDDKNDSQDSNAILASSPQNVHNSQQIDESVRSHRRAENADEKRHKSIGDEPDNEFMLSDKPAGFRSSRDKRQFLATFSNKSMPTPTFKIKLKHNLSISSSALQRQSNVRENDDELDARFRANESCKTGSDNLLFSTGLSTSSKGSELSQERGQAHDITSQQPLELTSVRTRHHSASKTNARSNKPNLETKLPTSDEEFVTIDEDEDPEEKRALPPGRYCVRVRKKSNRSMEKKAEKYDTCYDADGDTNAEGADDDDDDAIGADDEDDDVHSRRNRLYPRPLRMRIIHSDNSIQSQAHSAGLGKATLTPVLLTVPGSSKLDVSFNNKNEPVSPSPSLQTSSPSSSTSTSSSSSSFTYNTHLTPTPHTSASSSHLPKVMSYSSNSNSDYQIKADQPASTVSHRNYHNMPPCIESTNTITLDPTIVSATSIVSTKIHKIPAFQMSGEKTTRSNASIDQTVSSFTNEEYSKLIKEYTRLREQSFDESKKLFFYEDAMKGRDTSASKLDQLDDNLPLESAAIKLQKTPAVQASIATIKTQEQSDREPTKLQYINDLKIKYTSPSTIISTSKLISVEHPTLITAASLPVPTSGTLVSADGKKHSKRSALAWVGRTVGRKMMTRHPTNPYLKQSTELNETCIDTKPRMKSKYSLQTSFSAMNILQHSSAKKASDFDARRDSYANLDHSPVISQSTNQGINKIAMEENESERNVNNESQVDVSVGPGRLELVRMPSSDCFPKSSKSILFISDVDFPAPVGYIEPVESILPDAKSSSKSLEESQSPTISNNSRTNPTANKDTTVTSHACHSRVNSFTNSKKSSRVDWTENAKAGTHVWSDIPRSTQSNDSCYLSEQDAIIFHKLELLGVKRCAISRNETKKKCNICKMVVHESCIDIVQAHVKCKFTFREATNKKKSFREKENTTTAGLSSSSPLTCNLHHWLCRKYDEENFENKCQACVKSFTRFGMQSPRTVVSCSWCKAAYHQRCFSDQLTKLECNLGEHNQLIVPPMWIIKLSHKNSLRSSFLHRTQPHRSSKRLNHQHSEHTPATTTHLHPDLQHSHSLSVSSANSSSTSNVNPNPISTNHHVNYLHQHSIKHSNRTFVIRPPPVQSLSNNKLTMVKPLLVLINPKSGGKLGPKLLKKFNWLLNPRQVFDLTHPGGPKLPLHLYRNVPNLKLLVGGGDGTVGWVLSVIDQINFMVTPPSVAVLPLGTGNDLARALNWGSGYTEEPLHKILNKILESRSVKLDRWKITTEPNPDVDLEAAEYCENAVDKLKNDVMNNYFSLGADAHVCLEFHERREKNPKKFSSRWFNLLQYAEAGGKDMIKKTWKDLTEYIKLECDNINYTEYIKARGFHCLIFLNISKYSSGTNPWGTTTNENFYPQSLNDGRMEVIGCFTSHLAKFQLGGTGERICQAKHIRITTSTCIPIQIDGEPARLNPSLIEIKFKNQAIMLEHVKYNTDSPVLGFHASNIQKNFEVKCILLNDYNNYRKDPYKLEANAIKIGNICTSNLTDPLSKVRMTINLLLMNCASGFYTSKWCFLSADEFCRVNDDSDECLLDIVSADSGDQVVYILDEQAQMQMSTFDEEKNESTSKLQNMTSEKAETGNSPVAPVENYIAAEDETKSSIINPESSELAQDLEENVTKPKSSLKMKCDSSRNLYDEHLLSNRQKRQTSTLSLLTDVKSGPETCNISGSSDLNYFYNLTF